MIADHMANPLVELFDYATSGIDLCLLILLLSEICPKHPGTQHAQNLFNITKHQPHFSFRKPTQITAP